MAAPAGKMTFSVGENFREKFFAALSLINKNVTKVDEFAQGGFLFDNARMILGASSSESSVDDGGDDRNDESFLHEHGGKELLFHFDGFGKFFLIHKNRLMFIRRQKKKRHYDECRLSL